ncbi:MAG TPA: class I SAM-dependent methyltransferase [Burkholderiales bacterium]|nr:class I SAM-dependent methyltransferase [Burkholderiales bacterium]
MIRQPRWRASFAVLCFSALVAGGQARSAEQPYVPQPGELGKDVMWLPTEDVMVRRMLDIAQVTARDFVVDLGSGDGRTVIAAARRGARAQGVELNPQLIEYSRRRAQEARVEDRASFVQGDLFEADLSQATVITLFLLDEINFKLRPKLLGLKPGTRVVSNTFTMGQWPADASAKVTAKQGCTSYCSIYFWIVPAKVGGAWKLPDGELTIKQEFQMISGTLQAGGKSIALKGRMSGDRISFSAGSAEYRGRVGPGSITGTFKMDGANREWTAIRK